MGELPIGEAAAENETGKGRVPDAGLALRRALGGR